MFALFMMTWKAGASAAWWPAWVGGIIGATDGLLGGIAGGLCGAYVNRGIRRGLVIGYLYVFMYVGLLSLVVGTVAITLGQPPEVYSTLFLVGTLNTLLSNWMIPQTKRNYDIIERRKMQAKDIMGE